MQKSQENISRTEKEIHRQIKFIYEHLIKLGYPKLLQLSLKNISQIQTYLASYFQSTPSRMQLVQWLIAIIFPQYREMAWYITEKDHVGKIMKCLWKIGVMPVNKHTKNLDYKKYVQATLGYENAVTLIYNLVELAYETVLSKKAKNDVSFGQFFHQLIENFSELINENYDVYGITFPSKYINVNQMKQLSQNKDEEDEFLSEFQKQYDQFYKEKMIPLLKRQDQLFDNIYAKNNKKNQDQLSLVQNKKSLKSEEQQQSNDLEKFVDQLSKYGREYSQKYKKLVEKIDELLQTPQIKSRLIPYFVQKQQQKMSPQSKPSVKDSIQNRTIKITPEFCKKYINYKKILKQIKHSKDDQQFMDRRTKLISQIQKINQEVCI